MHPQSPALRALAEKWDAVPLGERATFQSYVGELCTALGVASPMRGSGYEFEFPVTTTDRHTGKESTNFIDLYRRGHFILEAKHVDAGADRVLGAAYGQAKGYAGDVAHGPPPYLMVMNVARTLLLWDRWGGNYGGINAARRIDLRTLWQRDDEVELLRAVWEHPESLNPAVRGRVVTREVAERLAKLSASLEGRGIEPERVARFLIRCVFTMFAEDVGLLQGKTFQGIVDDTRDDPAEFRQVVEDLWRKMDKGQYFGPKKLLRFNGHFFHDPEVLELTPGDLAVLADAARADWRQVEPSIFGTLLTRALDPAERHRLGAEFTPREYVERVVRQTVDVPLRERWAPVQAHAVELTASKRKKDRDAALAELRGFHEWMRGLRFLDPACGSGNFLYVTLHMVKRLELEVLRAIEEITGNPELGIEEVGPWQFHGIEIKPWAREIAELTLWIGYHQFWMEHHKGVNPPEPVLKDTGTLELRDAVLAWDEIVEVPEKSRPDPTPRIVHPVTGKLVPDPDARLPYYEYRGARQAEWPQADFIIGNPPYMGQARQREAFGDGYVNVLRSVYKDVPDTADYVMYWWYRAAEEVTAGVTNRAGLITTNTITQKQNRAVIATAHERGAKVVWAVADHPWVDEAGSAAVRVAFTILSKDARPAILVHVDDSGVVLGETQVSTLNYDLSASVNVAAASSELLLSNTGLSFAGFQLYGAGFIIEEPEAQRLIAANPANTEIIKPYRNGRDITGRPRNAFVIDFGFRTETEARAYPMLFDIVRDRVKPERDANARAQIAKNWWQFGWPRRELREAIHGLTRFIITPETAKHRFFLFVDRNLAPDNMLTCIALSDGSALGVLSSSIHVHWALSAGGTLEDRPRYNKTTCFDPFPFPDPPKHLRERIGLAAEALDQHRKDAIARDERVTMTGMYNVVEKLRSGEKLTEKERAVHEIAACGVLRDLHDTLDQLVAEAYGWPWPMEREEVLERLVALHDERVEEEKRGTIRWLRPEYQVPRFGGGAQAAPEPALDLPEPPPAVATPAEEKRPWPAGAIEQIGAVKARVAAASATPAEVADAFDGAPAALVARHLETLAMVGEVRGGPDDGYEAVAEPL
ncbi:MAG: class I SAM-dependent DNA methyltransferase [Longimicrobiaceae bacterium]